jgi:hypothetical protein
VFHKGPSLGLFAGMALLANFMRNPDTPAERGLSLDAKNPLSLDGPGSVVKLGYHRPGGTNSAANSHTINLRTTDDKARNHQPHAPDFKAPPLSKEIQAELARQIKLSGLEDRIRSGMVKITSIHVHGLSSPEGSYASDVAPGNTEPENIKLAMERAKRCLDEAVGPALMRVGVSKASLDSIASFSAEEVQLSPEDFSKLHSVATKHNLGMGLQHDAVHRLIRNYNAGNLKGLNKEEATLLKSTIDDTRGSIVTLTLEELQGVEITFQSVSPATDLTFLIPPFIPIFSRKREPKRTEGKGSAVPNPKTPEPNPGEKEPSRLDETPIPVQIPIPIPREAKPSPDPLDHLRERDREPQAFTPPPYIPFPTVPGRTPEQVKLDVVIDLYTHMDVHPKVDYRTLLAQAKLTGGQESDIDSLKTALAKDILVAWSQCDNTDYSQDPRQQAYARAHAEVLVALDSAKPDTMDILDKLTLYTASTSADLPSTIDARRTSLVSNLLDADERRNQVRSEIAANKQLYESVAGKVQGALPGQTSEPVIKRRLEGEIYRLWERLDGVSQYHDPEKQRWAAAFAAELYSMHWPDLK